MYASLFEGVAFIVGGNVLHAVGVENQYLPLLAVIVGLHFLPFARYVPDKRYYVMATVFVTLGVVGAVMPAPDLRAAFVGVGCALVLWTVPIVILRTRDRAA